MSRDFRNFLYFCVGISLATFALIASAANTGYQINERCHGTSTEALDAFKMAFQSVALGTDYELCGDVFAPVIVSNVQFAGINSDTAVKYYKMNNAAGSSVCSTATAFFFGLPRCDPETQGIAFSGTNALFLVLAFFYAAMLGFKTSFRA